MIAPMEDSVKHNEQRRGGGDEHGRLRKPILHRKYGNPVHTAIAVLFVFRNRVSVVDQGTVALGLSILYNQVGKQPNACRFACGGT